MFYYLIFLQGSSRPHHTDPLDQGCTPHLKFLHNSGHKQFKYVTCLHFFLAQLKLFFKKSICALPFTCSPSLIHLERGKEIEKKCLTVLNGIYSRKEVLNYTVVKISLEYIFQLHNLHCCTGCNSALIFYLGFMMILSQAEILSLT